MEKKQLMIIIMKDLRSNLDDFNIINIEINKNYMIYYFCYIYKICKINFNQYYKNYYLK